MHSADILVVMKGGEIVVQGPPQRVYDEKPEEMDKIIMVRPFDWFQRFFVREI